MNKLKYTLILCAIIASTAITATTQAQPSF